MKRYRNFAVLLILLSACTPQPPAYESRYEPPTNTPSLFQSSPLPTATPKNLRATFVDTFDRPDTQLGLGEGWDMRGSLKVGPAVGARDGFIREGRYTYAGSNVVYAIRKFRGLVRKMGAVGRFRKIGWGAETAFSMATGPDDMAFADMVHLVAERSRWIIELRHANGPFTPIAQGRFSPVLELDQDYEFEFEMTDNAVTVRVPGAEVTKDVDVSTLLGEAGFWQQYPLRKPAGVVFDFDQVWALEDGQPLLEATG